MSDSQKSARPAAKRHRYIPTFLVSMLMFLGTLWLFSLTALNGAASDRADAEAARLSARLSDLRTDAERLIRVGTDWLTAGDLGLDHRSLNRRFMPVLEQLEGIDSVRIADTRGNEWMLRRESDNRWLNRLSSAADAETGEHRFLIWRNLQELQEDKRQASDYSPDTQEWYKLSLQTTPGVLIWTQVHSLAGSGKPGIIAAMRLPHKGDNPLFIAVALRLTGLKPGAGGAQEGSTTQAALITAQGQFLDVSDNAGLDPAAYRFKSLLNLDDHPLKPAFTQWLERKQNQRGQESFWRLDGPWYVAHRALPLGDEQLWLLSLTPLSALLPNLPLRLGLLVGLFVLALFVGRSRRN